MLCSGRYFEPWLHEVQTKGREIQGKRIRRSDHSKSKGKGKVVTCYYYKKEGHLKRDCPKEKKDLAKQE